MFCYNQVSILFDCRQQIGGLRILSEKNNAQPNQNSKSEANPACPYCQRRFHNMDELTLHIVTRHTQSGKARPPAQAGSGSK